MVNEPKGKLTTWNQFKLKEITSKIGSGKTPRGGASSYTLHGTALIRSQNIRNNMVDLSDVVYIDDATDQSMANTFVFKNDVLLNITGASIGRCAVYKREVHANVNQHVCIIRLDKAFNPDFLQLLLASSSGQNQINSHQAGGGREGLNFEQIRNMQFDFPSLHEQENIATALSDVDELIANLEKLIEKKKAIKQGVIEELLTHKKRLHKYKSEWESKKLESLCYLITKQTGFDYSATIKPSLCTSERKSTYPFIQNKDFCEYEINYDTDFYIPCSVAEMFPRILLDEPCLLISISGRIGNVAVFSNERTAFAGGAVGIAKFKDKSLIEWAMLYLMSSEGQKQIFLNEKVGAQHNLTVADVRNLNIPIPPEEEMLEIQGVIREITEELVCLENKLKKYKQLKQGMMQKLLTGQIRLV